MREYLGNIFRKVIKKNKIGFSDYFAVTTLVLVLVLSTIFKFNFNELTDSRLFAAYDTPVPPTAVPTAVPTVAYNCPSRCSNNFGCKRANAYTSSTADCNSPIGTVSYSDDCSCNFNEADANCIANCKCSTCTSDSATLQAYRVSCSALKDYAPVFGGLVIKNDSGVEVETEAGNRNQICQTEFNGSRALTFEVTASDQDGITNITSGGSVTLTWNGRTIPQLGYTENGVVGVFTFGWTGVDTMPSSWNNSAVIYPLKVTIMDSVGTSIVDISRSFKVWDCQIPVSGIIYDATEASQPFCPTNGFNKLPESSVLNFTSLTFQNGPVTKDMTVNPDGISYDSGSNGLTWGVDNYIPKFNDKISLSDSVMRAQSSLEASPTCGNWYLDTKGIDPYSNSPTLTADFSGILIQDPWWQASGGGVVSNSKINGQVPATCTSNCKISLNSLVSAPEVFNDTTKSLEDAQDWLYFGTSAIKLANVNTNYNYFYNQFFVKKGVGTVINSGTTIANVNGLGSDVNNIYFINGDLTITGDIENINKFLMIIVSGDITVTQDVKKVDGILVANNIYATGESETQLVFNGSLFAFNNVDFSRGYITRLTNNFTPSVVVNYNPELMFNMPGSVVKILTNWQWGN